MAQDPVCGMHVDERMPAATAEYERKTFYFCSEGCRERFHEKPDVFVARQKLEREKRI